MKKNIFLFSGLLILTSCGGGGSSSSAPPVTEPEPIELLDHSGLPPLSADNIDVNEALSGGITTVSITTNDAFSQRPAPVKDDLSLDGFFTSGDHFFRSSHKGVGPLLNSPNCQGCHLNDGKGIVPESSEEAMTSMFMKIGDALGNPDPVYGNQLQTFGATNPEPAALQAGLPVFNGSIDGAMLYGEGYAYIEYKAIEGTYPDGNTYSLRQPIYKVKNLSYGPFNESVRLSPRVAPFVFGSGLLEAIPEENILKLADENDSDSNGISGKASTVTDVLTGNAALGRFSYKAQNPSVLQQISAAYRGDMGNTNKLFPEEPCTDLQQSCQNAATLEERVNTEVDVDDKTLAFVEFYNRSLAVPARRGYDQATQTWNEEILVGRRLFYDAKCDGCHVARHVTGKAAGSVLGELTLTGLEPDARAIAYLSNQVIFPYTDLLLHDMGGSCNISRETETGDICTEGETCLYVQRCDGLADGLIEGSASGTEWKTPPLWGVGLVKTVNPKSTFLHDGRARNLEEAILWHGGEAQASHDAFKNMSLGERESLLAFLRSL